MLEGRRGGVDGRGRARWASPASRLRLVKQVHGIYTWPSRAVASAAARWTRPQADIIVTDDPVVAIGVRVADCAPILLHDPREACGRRRARGLAGNRGGRGRRGGARDAGRVRIAPVGSGRRDRAVPGGSAAGRSGPTSSTAFRAGGADAASMAAWFSPGTGDRSFLDLERANRDQLAGGGRQPGRDLRVRAVHEDASRAAALVSCATATAARAAWSARSAAPSERSRRSGTTASPRSSVIGPNTGCPSRARHRRRWCRRADRGPPDAPGSGARRRPGPADPRS